MRRCISRAQPCRHIYRRLCSHAHPLRALREKGNGGDGAQPEPGRSARQGEGIMAIKAQQEGLVQEFVRIGNCGHLQKLCNTNKNQVSGCCEICCGSHKCNKRMYQK
jgi:hypothetical protein